MAINNGVVNDGRMKRGLWTPQEWLMLQVAQMVPVIGLSHLACEQRLSRRGQPLCRRDVVIASVSQVVFFSWSHVWTRLVLRVGTLCFTIQFDNSSTSFFVVHGNDKNTRLNTRWTNMILARSRWGSCVYRSVAGFICTFVFVKTSWQHVSTSDFSAFVCAMLGMDRLNHIGWKMNCGWGQSRVKASPQIGIKLNKARCDSWEKIIMINFHMSVLWTHVQCYW